MIAIRAIVKGVGLMLCEAADDEQPIAKRRERRQDRRQLESGAFAGRRPVVDAGEVLRDAVRQIDETEAATGLAAVCASADNAGTIASSSGSAERRAHAAQERAPRQSAFLGR